MTKPFILFKNSHDMDNEEILGHLIDFGKRISRETNLNALFETLGDFSRDIVNADRCSIFVFDKNKHELWTKVSHGVEELRMPADKGIAGFVVMTGEIQIVTDAYNDFRFYDEIDKQTGYRTRSLLAVPLFDKNENVIGVIQVVNKKKGFFTNNDAELLILISNYIGSTLENAILYEKLNDTKIKLVYKLSTAAEFKDEETSLHTKRVAFYSAVIAGAYGLSRDDVENLIVTAPMHDVGKIGIPDNIIKKNGKLTDEEFDIIKTHTTIGYNLLQDDENEILQEAAIIARDHHEKWNGRGYPKGIAEEEISLHGRIVAVADVFDALTSRRPYKEPWSVEKALNLLKKESGIHFDPNLVELFMKNRDEVMDIHEKYKE